VRWKRWLVRLHYTVCGFALAFLLCFAADWLFGFTVGTLRILSAMLAASAGAWLVVDWCLVWLPRVDQVGLAHLLEKRFPDLAERLVTLVQLQADEASPEFARILESEVELQLSEIDPQEACPLAAERTLWLRTLGAFVAVLVVLGLTTPLASFAQRFSMAWATPLTPFRIVLTPQADVALRGIPFSIRASIEMIDEAATMPAECELVITDLGGASKSVSMTMGADGAFLYLDTVQHPALYHARIGTIVSKPISVDVADPFTIALIEGSGYALRGDSHRIVASLKPRDARATLPKECTLLTEDESGRSNRLAMKSSGSGRYAVELKDLRRALTFRVKAGEVVSERFTVRLIDVPAFTRAPALRIDPPPYVKCAPDPVALDPDSKSPTPVVRFSRIRQVLQLDRAPVKAVVRIESRPTSSTKDATVRLVPLMLNKDLTGEIAEILAADVEHFSAALLLDLGHGLSKTLPLGRWQVQDDQAPRFTQPLRFQDGSALLANLDYRVSAKEALKLRAIVEDDAGLDVIFFEYRVNDGPVQKIRWIDAKSQRMIVIDHWLPLPTSVKDTDRVQFRLLAIDNRNLKRGDIRNAAGVVLPATDLQPHVTIAPDQSSGDPAWITLRIDSSADDYLKVQAKAQSDDVFDTIIKIKQKVQSELDQVQQLQGPIHRQAALTLAQLKQADDLRTLNNEISGDLLAAAKKFSGNPDLAKLSEHFLDIAEIEMTKSAEALKRFSEKDRALLDAEKDLQASQQELISARAKLDRMLALNKLITQDRLDQFQLDRLARRQEALAQRLEKLLADEKMMNNPDAAKEVEAIRNEQAKLTEEAAKIEEQSPLVKESMQSLQVMRAEQLAKETEQLAAEQRKMRDAGPDELPKEIKERIAELARRQTDLADRAKAVESKDSALAADAAEALKKSAISQAIGKQREHEKQLKNRLDKLLPGTPALALRDQILQLAKKQQAIHVDLKQLARDVDNLEFSVFEKAYRDLGARQQEMAPAITKLPIDAKNETLWSVQQRAHVQAKNAADQMGRENAAGAKPAYDLMHNVQHELEKLASLIPATLPTDPSKIDDPKVRATVEKVQKLAKDQQHLREETQKLLGDAAKASAGKGKGVGEKLEKLAADLKELSQSQAPPETKAMAKESAEAIDAAKKALEASQEMKAKGNADDATKLEADAEKQLEFAAKKLAKLSQDQPKGDAKMSENAKTAEALKDGLSQMRKAQDKLPTGPKDAQAAMNAAAKNLQQAAQSAAKLSSNKVPQPARNPATQMAAGQGPRSPGSLAKDLKFESLSAEAWGQLPGELKTRMLQDARTRFGAEYAETIRQYFESLADAPAPREKNRK